MTNLARYIDFAMYLLVNISMSRYMAKTIVLDLSKQCTIWDGEFGTEGAVSANQVDYTLTTNDAK